jgi:uncharacterized membrane protein YdjX (TVP38/TMEM64 family)
LEIIRKYKWDILTIVIVSALILAMLLFKDSLWVFNSRPGFESFVKGYGILAPIVIIISIIFEVIVAPIPGFVPLISAGFIFGTIEGSIYAYIGNTVGSIIAFWLARRYGKKLVTNIIKEEKIAKYEEFINKRSWVLFAMYFFPIFPTDIISFAFGLSKVKFKKFVVIVSIGFIFNTMTLTFFGNYLANLYF